MQNIYRIALSIGLLFCSWSIVAQRTLPNAHSSYWIAAAQTNRHAYGVFHFRKKIQISRLPVAFYVTISADQRYRFFVNGEFVCCGPARGDNLHWRLDSVDIIRHLHAGTNLLAAVVWNDGENTAWAQMSVGSGFFLRGGSDSSFIVNSDRSWKVMEDMAYTPVASISHITGAFEQVFAERYPWGWETAGYDDSGWPSAIVTNDSSRSVVPRDIPFPEEKMQRIPVMRTAEKDRDAEPAGFLQGNDPLKVGPWTDTRILLDQQQLTTAYPALLVTPDRRPPKII